MDTILEAKEYLRNNYTSGCECPCCGQFVKLYKRKLNSGMALTLIRLHGYSNGGVNIKDWLREMSYKNNHDWTLLRFWGLLREEEVSETHGGKTAGFWKITPSGRQFVENRLEVRERIVLYNNKFRKFEGPLIKIRKALGNKFNYYELMGYPPPQP